ncbi:hypothetical protein AB685_20495 [Bacillus sp. LL01]|uniref:Na-translocating system protein MpsC family protein n=1 Tax=Bacillus sp. LL01 TaxID=1665556 RepID=UPI00064D2D07|nr:Na-translocating system protein MpsC family protein [Bacillus sp. LL01]KMJ56650.1 hypothetical protein AB685_20495 [Bacillus sp. LL01]
MGVKVQQSELSSGIGRILRKHFGKGPESVFVSISAPYVAIYLRNFLTPMEQLLLEEHHVVTVEETRDKMMQKLAPEMMGFIHAVTGIDVKEFYYDWSFKKGSGLLVGMGAELSNLHEYNYQNSSLVEREISLVSEEAEKYPEVTYSHMLSNRTLVVMRKGILVKIEQELIDLGYEEALTIAKRKLEKRLLYQRKELFEDYLDAKIDDIFVNWDFTMDKSIIVFILSPHT